MNSTTAVPIEVLHGPHAIEVVVQLPGALLEHLHIDLTPDRLTIDADAPAGLRAFSVPLAFPVDDRRTTIDLENGVLRVYMPRLKG
jgi:HSP20 family molecular chaperone IbpA